MNFAHTATRNHSYPDKSLFSLLKNKENLFSCVSRMLAAEGASFFLVLVAFSLCEYKKGREEACIIPRGIIFHLPLRARACVCA